MNDKYEFEPERPDDEEILKRYLMGGSGLYDDIQIEIRDRANNNPGFLQNLVTFIIGVKRYWKDQPPSENNPLVLDTIEGGRFHDLEILQGHIMTRNHRRNAEQTLELKRRGGKEGELPY